MDLTKGEAFGFLGFTIRRRALAAGQVVAAGDAGLKQRTALLRKLKEEFPAAGTPSRWGG